MSNYHEKYMDLVFALIESEIWIKDGKTLMAGRGMYHEKEITNAIGPVYVIKEAYKEFLIENPHLARKHN